MDKEKKKPQPIKPFKEPPVIVEKPNEEKIKNQPVIQELNLRVTALAEAVSGSFVEVNKKFQSYDIQAKDTNEKITALGQAVSILNDEFSQFMENLQAKLTGAPAIPGGDNTPPGTNIISSKRVPLERAAPAAIIPETPPSTGDKLLQWANLLAGLAGPGKSEGGGGGLGQASSLLELVLKLQDNAEERALKRTESSIKNIAAIANLLMGKKVEVPIETTKPETTPYHKPLGLET